MTVEELIEHLKQYRPGALMLVDGYETGFDTPRKVVAYHVRKRADADQLAPHDGHYELCEWNDPGAVLSVAIETRRG